MYTHTVITPRIARFGILLASFIIPLLTSGPVFAYLTPDEALNGLFPSQQSPGGSQIPQLHPAIPTLNLGTNQIPQLPNATSQIPHLPTGDDIIPQLPQADDDIVPLLPVGSSSSSSTSSSGGGSGSGGSGGSGGGNGYDPNCAAYGCPYGYPNYPNYPNQYYPGTTGYKPYPPVLSVGGNNSGAPLSHTGPGLIVAMTTLGLSALWTIRKAVKAEAMA